MRSTMRKMTLCCSPSSVAVAVLWCSLLIHKNAMPLVVSAAHETRRGQRRNLMTGKGKKERDKQCTEGDSVYDYIIVGAGAGGSTAAYKLAKDAPDKTVLLVEEGGYARFDEKGVQDIFIAANWFGLIWNYEIAKQGYDSTPQDGLNGRSTWNPRSKVVGGCTAHNAYVFALGSRAAYDEWQNGWSWEVLQPHWETILQNYQPTTNNGTLPYPTENAQYLAWLKELCLEGGWEWNDQFNAADGGVQHGCNYRQHAGHYVANHPVHGPMIQRVTAYSQFVDANLGELPNLRIKPNTLVQRMIMEGTTAVGIEARDPFSSGGSFNLYAREEVILAAGVFDSPKLLMLSGIGPREHLEDMGIPVVVDLPGVGKHLKDDGFAFVTGGFLLNQPPDGWNTIWPIEGLQTWGKAGASDSIPAAYNLNLYIQPGSAYDAITGNLFKEGLFLGASTEMLSLQSEGTVTLQSTDAADAPIIDNNYLSHPDDIAQYVEAIKDAIQLLQSPSVLAYTDGVIYDPPANSTDAEIEHWVRRNWGGTDFHVAGTCRMGPDPENGDVVDGHLRVHGTTNLRVIDASIIPSLTHGNTAQPSMLIGLRGAEIILEEQS